MGIEDKTYADEKMQMEDKTRTIACMSYAIRIA